MLIDRAGAMLTFIFGDGLLIEVEVQKSLPVDGRDHRLLLEVVEKLSEVSKPEIFVFFVLRFESETE